MLINVSDNTGHINAITYFLRRIRFDSTFCEWRVNSNLRVGKMDELAHGMLKLGTISRDPS